MAYKLPKMVFIFSVVTCVLIRVWIKLTMIDPTTGFYLSDSPVISFFNILLGVSVVLLPVLSLLQKPAPTEQLQLHPGLLATRLSSLLCGAGAFFAAAGAAYLEYDRYLSYFNWGVATDTIAELLIICLRMLVLVVLPIIAGCLWFAAGFCRTIRRRPWMSLAFPIWLLVLSVLSFLEFTALRSVSDQQLGMVMVIFSLPLALAWARLFGGVDPARGARHLMVFGFSSALCAFAIPAGMLAGTLAGKDVTFAFSVPLNIFYLCLALHTTVLLFSSKYVAIPVEE